MKLKTTIQIDVASYSKKEAEMCKLQFSNLKIEDNTQAKTKIISFIESKIVSEGTETQVERIDENGDFVFDDNGDQIFDTVIKDNIQTLRNVREVVPYDTYNQVAAAIKENLPDGLSQTDIDNTILTEGIKIFIVQEGYYRGALTLNDFE